MEQFEFQYNLERMSVTALINIQISQENRIIPSQLWPDWNTSQIIEPEEDPAKLIEGCRSAIEFLKKKN